MQGELLAGEKWGGPRWLCTASAPGCRPLTHGVVRRRKQWVLVGMEEGQGTKQAQFLPFQPSKVFKLKEASVPSRQNEIPEVDKTWFMWPELAMRKPV